MKRVYDTVYETLLEHPKTKHLPPADLSLAAESVWVALMQRRTAYFAPEELGRLLETAKEPLEWDLRGDEEDDEHQAKALEAFEKIEKFLIHS